MVIDFHIHILPGIDDGSQDIETSLRMAKLCVADRVTHILSTPHGSSRSLATLLPKRDTLIAQLKQRLDEENIPLQIVPGLEYYADGHSAESALANDACRSGVPGHPDRPILVELPLSMDISFAKDLLFQAQLKGVTLILAHPERYPHFAERLPFLIDLMEKGLYLQFNASDLHNTLLPWGQARKILSLIQANPEQCLIGSDAHNDTTRPPGLLDAQNAVTRKLGQDVWNLLVSTTPARLLGLQ
ncbi:MAG: hypothetical protein IJJ26_05030 [Victivallales bacterium]|nr:hypothetical protein [Victivallales bacterium]